MQPVPAAAGPDRRAAGRRPDDDRRARRLVPARHRGHELPHASTSRRRSSPRRSTSPASGCATSTAAGCDALTGEDYRGIFRPPTRLARERAAAATPSWSASTPGRASTGDALRAEAREPLRPPSRPASRPATRSTASAARLEPTTCRPCSRATTSDYHAYAFATVRMAGAGFERPGRPHRLGAARRRRCGRGVGGASGDSSTPPRC